MTDKNTDKLKEYEEALSYLFNSDRRLVNPKLAYEKFDKLAKEGYVIAETAAGCMQCMGMGTEKNIREGKERMKKAEEGGSIPMVVLLQPHGLVDEDEWNEYCQRIKDEYSVFDGLLKQKSPDYPWFGPIRKG